VVGTGVMIPHGNCKGGGVDVDTEGCATLAGDTDGIGVGLCVDVTMGMIMNMIVVNIKEYLKRKRRITDSCLLLLLL